MERALQNGVNIQQIFNVVTLFRQEDNQTPIVLMSYLNPIEQHGYESFIKEAKKAGVDGFIIVDMRLRKVTGY